MPPAFDIPLTSAVDGAVAGGLAAAIVAGIARQLHALTTTGMVAAIAVGACAAAAGWQWAFLLVFFFVSSSALSLLGATIKRQRTEGRIAKPGARDAVQVMANGGVFAAGAVLVIIAPGAHIVAAALGALAGAAGDTWATEIGVISSRSPRLITSLQAVPAGTSGGVTLMGTLAGCAGACSIAGVAMLLGISHGMALPVAIGGFAGMFADSLLGASVQAQRRCTRCGEPTERIVHNCGGATHHERGLRWLDNDGVNALATLTGALVAAAIAAGTAR